LGTGSSVPPRANVVVVAVLEYLGRMLGCLGDELSAGELVGREGLGQDRKIGDDGRGQWAFKVAGSTRVLCCHVEEV